MAFISMALLCLASTGTIISSDSKHTNKSSTIIAIILLMKYVIFQLTPHSQIKCGKENLILVDPRNYALNCMKLYVFFSA